MSIRSAGSKLGRANGVNYVLAGGRRWWYLRGGGGNFFKRALFFGGGDLYLVRKVRRVKC